MGIQIGECLRLIEWVELDSEIKDFQNFHSTHHKSIIFYDTYYSQEKDATTANDPTRNVDVLDDADDVNVDAVRLSRLQLQ